MIRLNFYTYQMIIATLKATKNWIYESPVSKLLWTIQLQWTEWVIVFVAEIPWKKISILLKEPVCF